MTDPIKDRRTGAPDTGERRREMDQYEEWALRRDKLLFTIGLIIVISVGAASLFIDIKNPEIALAVLAAGGGFAGAPVALRLDERRGRGKRT